MVVNMKVLASDYDGTLNYGGITKAKIDAITRWQKEGNLFVLVTGRGAVDALNMREAEWYPCDYILANNGAIIMDNKGNIIADKRCDESIAKTFVEALFGVGCEWCCVHFDKDFFYVCKRDATAKEKNGYTLDNMPNVPFFTQINTALNNFDEAKTVTQYIKDKFGKYLNPLQNGRCIDIVSAETDKARGIYMLLEAVNAQYCDVVTVGDNINDEHMIKEFRSYAMANGVDYIKSIANDITTGIDKLIEKELSLK